jgi:uncharacterized phage protein (TIGR02220 family)
MPFIIIPDMVKKAKKLNPNAKLLYGDILSLSQQSGFCFANNKHLAKIYEFTERTISKLISELLEFGLIEIKNRTGDYGTGRAIVPLVTVENEQTFQQGRENVPRTNVLPPTNERSNKVEQTFQQGRTIEQETTNERSTIIYNIKDKLKDKENIIVKEVSEKQVFAPTPKIEIEDLKFYFETTQVCELLTERTGAKYHFPKTSDKFKKYGPYKFIKSLLEDGRTLEDIFLVIECKCRDWLSDAKMCSYLTPATLLKKSNFEKYLIGSQIKTSNNVNNGNNEREKFADFIKQVQNFDL